MGPSGKAPPGKEGKLEALCGMRGGSEFAHRLSNAVSLLSFRRHCVVTPSRTPGTLKHRQSSMSVLKKARPGPRAGFVGFPSLRRGRGEDPQEPGTKARLLVRHKLYCEALPGVADPKTTGSREGYRLYPGGRVVLVPATVQHTAELGCSRAEGRLGRVCLRLRPSNDGRAYSRGGAS